MDADRREKFLSILNAHYPEFFVTEMDNGIFYKSLERYSEGDIIEHNARKYVVLYGWHWTTYGDIPVYCAELEPEEIDIRRKLRKSHDTGTTSDPDQD